MNIKTDQMLDTASSVCELLKIFSNPHRLLILCLLIEGEKSVGEMAEYIGMRSSSVSQQLAILREHGVVHARREAQTMWYSFASPEAKKILETLYALYCTPSPVCDPNNEGVKK